MPSRSPYYALGLAGVAIVALGLVFALRDRGPAVTAAHLPGSVSEPASLSHEVALLRAEIAGLKAEASRPSPSPLPSSASLPEATSAPDSPDRMADAVILAAAAPPPPLTPEVARAHFEQVLESEPRDAAWAREEELSISDFVKAEAGDGAAVDSVSCRSSMCRLQVRFPNDTMREAFKMKIGLPPLNHGGFYQDSEGGRLVFFAAREGHPLPDVPPP